MTQPQAEAAAKDAYAIMIIAASNPKFADFRKLIKSARIIEAYGMQMEAEASGVIPPKTGVDDVAAMRAGLVKSK